MSARITPAIRQRIIELKRLLDRAKDAGENVAEITHVAKLMLISNNVEFGTQSLSGLLSLALDCAKTLEDGRQADEDNRRTFESLDRWLREASLIVASMRLSQD